MHSHQAAAPRDEFEEVLSAGRLRHAGTDIVVKEDRVETAQGLPVEHRRVFANDGLEGPRPLAKKPKGFAAGQDGGAVAVVFEVAVEDEQPARLERLDGRDGWEGLFKALPLRRTGDERGRLVRQLT